ncbi:hypothetical protein E1264_01480 [Actinomadura sp. KC216]|uniref:hypothetical protein n=1 Tax=Actinomadura sp. KC216 TaxID=2530370 RepID=UPI00104B4141|nr:hypothetical protein [Actinomadura sp. KC216]TDB91491.1 hypothetical protein E1264_01480 [Actinomadura sp. KC216]
MANRTVPQERLAALGAHLSARRLEVELTTRGLSVKNPDVPGCCPEVGRLSDVITCRPRVEDDARLWFYTSWNEPVAEAGHITDAAVFIVGYLRNGAKQ